MQHEIDAVINMLDELAKTPERIALIEQDRKVTALQLRNMVLNFRQFLCDKNACLGDRIVVALPRGIDATIVIYSAFSLGICYVPLDLMNPANRLQYIAVNSAAKYFVGKGSKPVWCPDDVMWLDIDVLDWKRWSVEAENIFYTNANCGKYPNGSDDLLVTILYTSGSTGNPKGVAVSRRAIDAFVKWMGNTFNINSSDNIASLAPLYFDLSIFDLFTSIYFGATIIFVPQNLTLFPLMLSEWLQKNKISVWYTVPSMLIYWASKGGLANFNFEYFRLILFAGEKFPTQQLLNLVNLLPKIEFYNLYGPTETNVCCYWRVNKSMLHCEGDLPIGHPTSYATLKLNVEGELLVKGLSVASGYINGINMVSLVDNDGWYHTGDRCSINSSQEYVFHGRIDRMLKCYGHRIEPGEIENMAYKFPGIKECIVIGIHDGLDNVKPALFFSILQEEPSQNISNVFDMKKFKDFLRANLVYYMYPIKIILLDSLPKLSNGKFDLISMKRMAHG